MLAGRDWAAEEEGGCEGKGEVTGDAKTKAKRLEVLPLSDVLEKAEHVIDVRLLVLTCALGNPSARRACRCPCLFCVRRTGVWAEVLVHMGGRNRS